MNKHFEAPQCIFSIIHLVLDSGERLPTLVHAKTWLPVRVATRWAVRYRRYQVQRSTLENNLRILKKVYTWARVVGKFDLDDFLTEGRIFDARQIESLAAFLRTSKDFKINGSSKNEDENCQAGGVIDAGYYDHSVCIVENFLKWSLDAANRGGVCLLNFEQLAARRTQLEALFESLYIRATASRSRRGLTDEEIEAIRNTIAPKRSAEGKWVFPENVFSPETCLRNWVMFETGLDLGVRRGELLKLRLDSLPRGRDKITQIKRYPDDPQDSRAREPAVKTTERVIPASRRLLNALREYMTLPPSLGGRVKGKSIYLFVTESGEPLSLDRADDIASKISQYSGIPFSWHLLRHTWAEKQADRLLDKPNGLDRLQYLGGWTSSKSPMRYIKKALEQKAVKDLQKYQSELYKEDKWPWE